MGKYLPTASMCSGGASESRTPTLSFTLRTTKSAAYSLHKPLDLGGRISDLCDAREIDPSESLQKVIRLIDLSFGKEHWDNRERCRFTTLADEGEFALVLLGVP
jgi:hypothetical protein